MALIDMPLMGIGSEGIASAGKPLWWELIGRKMSLGAWEIMIGFP